MCDGRNCINYRNLLNKVKKEEESELEEPEYQNNT